MVILFQAYGFENKCCCLLLLSVAYTDRAICPKMWHDLIHPQDFKGKAIIIFVPSTCSSICTTCNGWSKREWSTLGSGWLGYSPRSRAEWHDHILHCTAARHTRCCCPEWDSYSAGPNLWLTSVTCSQPHQFEAIHQLCVESCSHNHCWNWSFFINWHYV